MIFFEIKNTTGKIIAGNMQEFSRRAEFENNRTFIEYLSKDKKKTVRGVRGGEDMADGINVWLVVEDEKDLLLSSGLFKKTLDIYKKAASDIWKYQKTQFEAHAHTLETIQGQIRQQIEGFADDTQFYGDTYRASVESISNLVGNDIKSAADLICYVHQRVIEMRAHMLGVEVIHAGAQYEIKMVQVSLMRAIYSQCFPFLEALNKNEVVLKFHFSEDHKVEVDKNMFSLVMYNFFSNAVKYAKPNTEIHLTYSADTSTLDVGMTSLKIEKTEIKSISNETVRGRHAGDIPGKGIGLFVLQKALELMGKKGMYIIPNYENESFEGDRIYTENHFKFFL